MNPQDDQQNQQVGMPRRDQPISQGLPAQDQSSSQQAAVNIVRNQLDAIYSGEGSENTPHTTPVEPQQTPTPTTVGQSVAPQQTIQQNQQPQPAQQTSGHGLSTKPPQTAETEFITSSPYHRTMSTESTTVTKPTQGGEQWQQYHKAWQKYYQLYYERQYLNNVYSQKLANQGEAAKSSEAQEDDGTISQEAAMRELRESIRKRVSDSAEKVKKSRHFMPAVAGIAVLIIFMFLQYNRVIFGAVAAYVTPGNIEPQNIIVDPTVSTSVGPEPRMIIPKINIDAPVVYGIGPDYKSQMAAMEKGIAHFSIPGANAVPGQVGNTVMAAHSSNDVFASGDYKFVFAQNEKLTKGDIIYMNYQSKRYTYSITKMEVVMPNEVSKVQLKTDKPMLTLVSCVPLGTAQKRLLVFAEQVNPDPTKAKQSTTKDETAPQADNIPGKPTPTIIERIFGAR